ncbi:uncharacterized protein DUF1015 [Anaerobacterium chartisolvens]|uniref:Uncharacterized protein DUF1015 n=1 Tax=Anaerobacterium chartisolvens TaxID=1297424 RepID=A0A369AXA6_9FIRM|nr:DUF1015 domain-containing protein [Anaerobacterium chartisolvens]RCX13791.1 uncharacterized protein DUF1015 [Anaerobacterium chartisolvens]
MDKAIYEGFKSLGIQIPELLLPAKGIDMEKWSVVACDQYTSQPEYWQETASYIADSPSTLSLIFPEVYLEDSGGDQRIESINASMKSFVEVGILAPQKPGFIYVDRKTCCTGSRKGLMLAVDLERYDYRKGSQSLIRATEGTVIERLPPRIKVRENASLELPHIMLLIDDPAKTVIEPLADHVQSMEKLYDFELMMGGGHISGYRADSPKLVAEILDALKKLACPQAFAKKYNVSDDKGVLLFAVGDGNHSLATAKECWERIKASLSSEEQENHPSRYALVELVNVHDDGLVFEPIHRVVFNVEPGRLLDSMVEHMGDCCASYRYFDSKEQLDRYLSELPPSGTGHTLPFVSSKGWGAVTVDNPRCNLEVGTLQDFLDELSNRDENVKTDYIHGEDVVDSLGSQEGNMGFYLPPMDKNDLFKTVILDGVLPRKTFSMGEASEKRFYLECRKIKP